MQNPTRLFLRFNIRSNTDRTSSRLGRATPLASSAPRRMASWLVDGDFPRDVLGGQNLTFAEYKMPARRNNAEVYDAKTKRAGGKKQGILKLGYLETPRESSVEEVSRIAYRGWLMAGITALVFGAVFIRRRRA